MAERHSSYLRQAALFASTAVPDSTKWQTEGSDFIPKPVVPPTTIHSRSRIRLREFYGALPSTSTEITLVQAQLGEMLRFVQCKEREWGSLGELGLLLLTKLHQLNQLSSHLDAAVDEEAASLQLRQEFGLPQADIFDLALPVYLELMTHELTAQAVVQTIAAETAFINDALDEELMLAEKRIDQESSAAEQAQKQWGQNVQRVARVNHEGHAIVANEQGLGISRSKQQERAAEQRVSQLNLMRRELEEKRRSIARYGVVFSQQARRSITPTSVEAIAA